MGRLERGTDLVRALRRVCADHSVRTAEIRALGALESVEICAYEQKNRTYGPARTFKGDLEILSLTGNVSEKQGELALHLHITLARDTDNGIQVLGGHLLSGKVFACEFVINTCDDLILRRGVDKATGLPLWRDKIEFSPDTGDSTGSSPPPGGAGPSGGEKDKPTWKDVMEAALDPAAPSPSRAGDQAKEVRSQRASSTELAAWVEPLAGDFVEHPTFGRVTVERADEGEFIHVRLRNGRLVRLSLDVLELRLVGHEEGHQVFEATVVQT